MKLHQIYNPLTATPFARNEKYMEFEPCAALRPYIKCFWGTRKRITLERTNIPTGGIVTPDTCMDIMFDVDFTNNRLSNSFCGINNATFSTFSKNDEKKEIFSFAIRFYAWSVVCFSEESVQGVLNQSFDIGYHFEKIKKQISPILLYAESMEMLIPIVEKILLANLHTERSNSLVLEALYRMMRHKGNCKIEGLAKDLHISNRQLERLFREYVGVSPKSMASMMRYQYLWNDVLFRPDFRILDAVHEYGYTDQAHLLRDFRKYHSMNIEEAKKHAGMHVAFLQDKV